MSDRVRTYSRLSQEALRLLGKQIRAARKEQRMSEADLAARVGIARSTLQQIEKGSPKVESGLMFEAAALAGVTLFVPEPSRLSSRIDQMDDRLALLPKSSRKPRREVKDDF